MESAGERLAALSAAGLDRLPLPGHGETLRRWQALAAVARSDLSLAKLYEGHTDALAIVRELDPDNRTTTQGLWAVWAAEAPGHRTLLSDTLAKNTVLLNGSKAWCSGAGTVTHALLTTWRADGDGPQLVQLQLDQPAVTVSANDWQAVAMAGSAGLTVFLDQARASRVGAIGSYLHRPGFWHGGAGVAACWYGGALALADTLRCEIQAAGARNPSPFRLAALGKVDLTMQGCAALLRAAAMAIDAAPRDDARTVVLRVRQAAEGCSQFVLDAVGRALGATPFCQNSQFARMAVDLPVFIRQSHAERDFAALGEQIATMEESPWQL